MTPRQNSTLQCNSYGRTLCKNQISRFVSDTPHSSFTKLIVSTPRLPCNLHPMSLVKAAPDGLKVHECKKMALHKCPLIPYVPEKDSVQETISSFKVNHLRMLISKGAELQVPIWHTGMHEAFLIHVGSAQKAIMKRGYFKSYEEYSGTFANKCERIKQIKSQLAELDETFGQTGTSKKPTKIPKRLRLKPVLRAQPPCTPTSRLSLSKLWRMQRKPQLNVIRRPRTCSSSTPTFCLSKQGTHGTRLSRNKPTPTPTQTPRANQKRAQGTLVFQRLCDVPPSHRVPQ